MRDCRNCKHYEKDLTQEPCVKCGFDFTKWEASEHYEKTADRHRLNVYTETIDSSNGYAIKTRVRCDISNKAELVAHIASIIEEFENKFGDDVMSAAILATIMDRQ